MHVQLEVEVLLAEKPGSTGLFAAKGIAETASVPTVPAVDNATDVGNGVRATAPPAKPEKIPAALRQRL